MKITLVAGNGLDALYVDGNLTHTENSIYITEGLEMIRIKYGLPFTIASIEFLDVDEEWLDEVGEYPQELKDAKLL